MQHPRRIAIVGSGVSGLVAAHELHAAGAEITLFEAEPRLGGHAHTVTVEAPDGDWRVDTGFIVLNDRNYPNFERLLDELRVPTQPAPMTFSVSDGAGDFEWAATPRGLFAKPGHLVDRRFHRMLADLRRFFREARELIGAEGAESLSLREFCRERGYSDHFVERLIVPQVSAVWSADPAQLWEFPARFLAEFLDNHGALQLLGRPHWRSVGGGSRTYVEAISAPFADRVRTGSPVRRVERSPLGVTIRWDGGSQRFDEAVLAVHSDRALAMLADPTPAEREVLSAIPYQANEVVLHTDTSLMPRRPRAWASWNYHLRPGRPGRTTITYDMNRLQRLPSRTRFLVSLNMTDEIDPARIIETYSYDHPVYTPEGIAAQARWAEVSGAQRVHYCGAYWGWGFHEDGVRSGLQAADAILGREPAALPGRHGTAPAPALPVAA
jgi:predicted NAD/FAD-binding protein